MVDARDAHQRPHAMRRLLLAAAVGVFKRPLAILGTVVLVVIDTTNRVPLWPLPHVGQEILKLEPPFVDLNTLRAVESIACRFWIGTTSNHSAPRFVCWRFSRALCMTMPVGSLSASTGFLPTKITRPKNSFVTKI